MFRILLGVIFLSINISKLTPELVQASINTSTKVEESINISAKAESFSSYKPLHNKQQLKSCNFPYPHPTHHPTSYTQPQQPTRINFPTIPRCNNFPSTPKAAQPPSSTQHSLTQAMAEESVSSMEDAAAMNDALKKEDPAEHPQGNPMSYGPAADDGVGTRALDQNQQQQQQAQQQQQTC